MKIGIAGLGSAGSYLAKRLSDSGFDVTSFDPKRPDYYIPCGYAVNENTMSEYMKRIGFDFSDYVYSRAETITFTGVNMPDFVFDSKGLCTFDKNRLENDVISKLDARREKFSGDFDLIIDATGVSRNILGPAENDFLMFTREYVTEKCEHQDFYFRYFSSGKGYYWEFPLGDQYHIGAGSSDLNLIDESLEHQEYVRITSRKIRLKPLFDQMFHDNIIGAGESIGTVSPITGEGIMPSIQCSEILFECIKKYDDLESLRNKYSQSVKKKFRHYEKLYALLMSFRTEKKVSVNNLGTVRSAIRTMKEFGIDFKISSVIKHFL